MTDSFVTRCPHCHTSFRLSSTQLALARGTVRCGACLQAFNANHHLLSKPVIPTKPIQNSVTNAAPTPAKNSPAEKATPWIHDDLDLDNLDLDEELARLEHEEQQLRQSLTKPRNPPPPVGKVQESAPGALAQADKSRTEKLLEKSDRQVQAADQHSPGQLDADDTSAPANAAHDAIPCAPVEPSPDRLGDSAETGPSVSPPQRTADKHKILFELDAAPLQLEWQPARKPKGRWLLWSLLSLLAAGALGVQYLAYNFEHLARQDQYRPWFQVICPRLGCTLPSKVDTSLIKSSNLVVRGHPEFAGALVVDAIIYNRASFSQPFPLLELRFSDLSGKILANRRFKPAEYLAGELAGQTEMPPQIPIHISLDILDPGPEAVNYHLDFQSPD